MQKKYFLLAHPGPGRCWAESCLLPRGSCPRNKGVRAHLHIPAINPALAAGLSQPFGCFEYILSIIANLIAINKTANNIIICVCSCLRGCTHVTCEYAHVRNTHARASCLCSGTSAASHGPRECVRIIYFPYATPGKTKSKQEGTERAACIIHLITMAPSFEPQPNHFVH